MLSSDGAALFVVDSKEELENLAAEQMVPVEGGFMCLMCGVVIKNKFHTARHVENVHVDTGLRYLCPVCQRELRTRHKFKDHMRKHGPQYRGLDPESCTVEPAKSKSPR